VGKEENQADRERGTNGRRDRYRGRRRDQMDMLRSVLDSESSASSSHTKSSSTSSVQDEIRRLEETIRTYSYEPEVNAKHYNMRTLVELTHEQLIRMTQEEIKGIFQMLCRELTAADFFSVKVGVRKENMPAHHHTGASTLRLLSCTRACNVWF
jgi:hypothetical protein